MEGQTSSIIKSIELEYDGRKYICKILIINEEFININIYLDNKLKYNANIFLEKIQMQIKAFLDYNINEIFEEICKLNNNNFIIMKENNKYKLKIKFIILRKKKYLYINLNNNNGNYENIIKEKDNIIFKLIEQIEILKTPRSNNKIQSVNCLEILSEPKAPLVVEERDDIQILSRPKEPLQVEYNDEMYIEGEIKPKKMLQVQHIDEIYIEGEIKPKKLLQVEYIDEIYIEGEIKPKNIIQVIEHTDYIQILKAQKPNNEINYIDDIQILSEPKATLIIEKQSDVLIVEEKSKNKLNSNNLLKLNISLKKPIKPIHILNYHSNCIYCLSVLND